ncbi:acyl-CoA dehydrogenase [Rhodococcus sp. MS16]|uniref:acyl-CoA dehydrogenase family protein n=1 Tax=Rhodococcus TaxID=1827 RepID=UPI001562CD70|nr:MULTISPECIES: acyl-CoA dehydrogenase family protein [Rhodococcus]MCE4265376.1 acyl-CoA dehydrogenase family protein [Rhodococcus globerulus]NRI64885.1 acyl-CoA dehydrogenase [Rhodococcus sp. MS16]
MDLTISAQGAQVLDKVRIFMDLHVYPAEKIYAEERAELMAQGRTNDVPKVLLELIATAKDQNLWNLFLSSESELTAVDYAIIAEETGRSPYIAPSAMNCQSPDSGNMEMLEKFATKEQRRKYLEPLLAGSTRSAFSMTEPAVASSDATNIETRIERDGDHYIINGRKWFSTGASDPRTDILLVLGQSDPEADRHQRHSVVIVPKNTPGVTVVRNIPVFGFYEQQGHAEVTYEDVRVPIANVLGPEGGGFAVAQARLGPGRVHHCMRAIGMAERALELMCSRATSRTAFGGKLADQGVVKANIAESRLEIDQARLLVLRCAWRVDQVGVKAARSDISAIKVVAPRMAERVLDRAIQLHGAAGVSDVTPLSEIWSRARTLRIVDGPEDVHIRTVARSELAPYVATVSGTVQI